MSPEFSARLSRLAVNLSQRPGGAPTLGLLMSTWTVLAEDGVLDLAGLDRILDLAGCSGESPARRAAAAAEERTEKRREEIESVDAESESSFPASDPPSHVAQGQSGAPAERASEG